MNQRVMSKVFLRADDEKDAIEVDAIHLDGRCLSLGFDWLTRTRCHSEAIAR